MSDDDIVSEEWQHAPDCAHDWQESGPCPRCEAVDAIEQALQTHSFEMLRNGSGNGECAPFPLGNPACGWSGHYSQHPRHVAEIIDSLKATGASTEPSRARSGAPWGHQLPTDIPTDGPTAEQISFARWVIRHIKGSPPNTLYWHPDDPRAWDDLKLFLRWAESEAKNRAE
ncbi:hypothetical protein [Mycobacterium asiaticum]|uniref:Uncharacterized protein n=1 Tax=Mycobacterium asiaticum TaxID=1790 RepID=A0A1A3NL08_MYCAS|nr:hypothetical protein [Mycobacterium asiaticum]OBK22511.1 hypothetical protein A5635_21580 [Mycobacterium asiaticum]